MLRPFVLAAATTVLAITTFPPYPGPDKVEAVPDLRLPWAAGQRMFVLQGRSQGTHTGPNSLYAYDFAPGPYDSTPFLVRAAAAGRVVEVVEQHPVSEDCDAGATGRDNYVLIDHGDGTGAIYRHLAPNGVLPQLGQRVVRGEPLSLTGHSGFVCGTAHLHFTAVDVRTRRSIDLPFADPDALRHGGRPQTGEWYLSANGLSSSSGEFRSLLPLATRRAPGRLVPR